MGGKARRGSRSRSKKSLRVLRELTLKPRSRPASPDVARTWLVSGQVALGETHPARIEAPNQKTLARLAENVWRLERRAERSVESASWAQPVIERLNDDLRELGVEIIDRTGTAYSDGETMEKVHSDAPADWSGGLLVTEVICPTIRITGQVVEPGKVVVGPDVREAKEDQ